MRARGVNPTMFGWSSYGSPGGMCWSVGCEGANQSGLLDRRRRWVTECIRRILFALPHALYSGYRDAKQPFQPAVNHIADLSVRGCQRGDWAIILSKFISAPASFEGGHEAALRKNLPDPLQPGMSMKARDPWEILGNPAVPYLAQHIVKVAGIPRIQFCKDGNRKIAVDLREGSLRLGRQSVKRAGAALPEPYSTAADKTVGLQCPQMMTDSAARHAQRPGKRGDSLITMNAQCL